MTIAEPIQRRLANNIVHARSARGWSQAELAEKSGVSRTTIAQIETTDGDPRFTTVASIAAALEVPLYLLVMTREDTSSLAKILDPDFFKDSSTSAWNYEEDVQELKTLLDSRILRDQRRASTKGYELGRKAGFGSAGALTAAAIGSALLPGIGTIVGGAIAAHTTAKALRERREKLKQVDDEA